MGLIQCKACGALYRYEKEGCCPKCGAYNRPPKRERVNADGTVQHMSDAAYERRQQVQGKVCFEEKECHEQKVCYENQARYGASPRPTGPAPRPTGPVPHAQFPPTQSAPPVRAPAAKKSSGAGCIVTFIILATLIGMVIMVAQTVMSTLGSW